MGRKAEGWLSGIDKIIPKTWNIVDIAKGEYFLFKPGILNVTLWLKPLVDDDMNGIKGQVLLPMIFWHFSTFAKTDAKAAAALKKYGDKTTAHIEMQIDDRLCFIGTVIHEFAHIAVARWRAWRVGKKYRDDEGMVGNNIENETMHGPIFQKAYERLIIRAEKVLEKKVVAFNRRDLRFFKKCDVCDEQHQRRGLC